LPTAEERIFAPVSDAELQRRWSAVDAAMQEQGIDALLMRGTNDYLGGYVKWFTDLPAVAGYPVTLVYPRGGGMTYVSQGQFGLDRRLSGDEMPFRGITRMLGAPGYASASFTARYEMEAVAAALDALSCSTVGVVGPASLPYALMDHLRTAARYEFRDASELVDVIKMVKSAEEIELIRRAAAMQDACMEAIAAEIRPGMRDIEVGAIAERVARSHGSEQGVYLVGSAPIGVAAPYGIHHYQGRVIEQGDYVSVLIENSGPGGFYTELGRTFVLGKATEEMHRDMELVLRAQDYTASLLVPGASCAEVWNAYNEFLLQNGRAEEKRLFSHGQGYDLVERPLIRHDESLSLGENMNIACHPAFVSATFFATSCDGYLTGGARAKRLHRFPRGLVELG